MAEPADVVAYSQEQFKAKYEAAEAREERLRNEFRIRRVIAYCLKAIVALGGFGASWGTTMRRRESVLVGARVTWLHY